MSASLRFLALAVVGWAGVRAATLGALPGTEAFTLGRAEPVRVAETSDVPAIVPTEFPAIEPAGAEVGQEASGLVAVGCHHLHLALVADGALGRPGYQHGEGQLPVANEQQPELQAGHHPGAVEGDVDVLDRADRWP